MNQMKLLITGCNRSGTTLLASMIGRHKEVAVLNEDYFDGVTNILSKQWSAVKAPIPNILYNKKNNLIITLFKRKLLRITKHFNFIYKLRGLYNYSIKDFLNDGKIIFISRDINNNISSIVNRTGCSRFIASKDVRISLDIKNKLNGNPNVLFIELEDLTRNTEKVLKKICKFLNIQYDCDMMNGYKYVPGYNNKTIKIKK